MQVSLVVQMISNNLKREFESGNFFPALFIGDSKYDYVSASSMDIDFLFLSLWTEFHEWESCCRASH